jgi:hypothetical protein
MIRTRIATALAAWLLASTAAAQDTRPTAAVTVLPIQPAKWDAAMHAT